MPLTLTHKQLQEAPSDPLPTHPPTNPPTDSRGGLEVPAPFVKAPFAITLPTPPPDVGAALLAHPRASRHNAPHPAPLRRVQT